MADNINIIISAILNKNTGTELQRELDEISKSLKLNINATIKGFEGVLNATGSSAKATQQATQALTVYEKALNSLIHKYKMKQIADDNFLKSAEKAMQMAQFQELSWKKQEQVINLVAQAEKNYQKVRDEGYKTDKRKEKEEELNRILQERIAIYKQEAEAKLSNLKVRYGNLTEKPSIQSQISEYQSKINNITPDNFNIKQLNADYKTLEANIKASKSAFAAANRDVQSLGDQFMLAWRKMMIWAGAGTLIFGTIRQFKAMVNVVSEVDKSLTEINKVLDLNNDQLKELAINASSVAEEYGKTTTEVLKTTAAFAKAGLDKETAQNMAKLALLLSNVGDITIESAQETLIAANAGYQLGNSYQSLLSIIDKFNEIANQNATEVSELSEAWKVSAATAKQAGLSIDEYTALVGTAQSVTQRSGAEIGNAWRTILMRIQGVSDGVDTLEEDISKAEQALNSIGIAVRKSPNEFRPAMEVLEELATKFNNLSTVEQSYVTEALAGKYRANILKSTLQNFDMVNKQIIESMNSSGSAMRENERYMQSIEARTKQFTATWQSLAQTIIQSDWIKAAISFGIDFLNVIERIVKSLGGWNLALVAVNIAAIALSKTLKTITLDLIAKEAFSLGAVFKALIPTLLGLSTATGAVNTQLTIMNVLIGGIPLLIGAITVGIMAWANHQQKLKEQIEATNKAQSDFNKVLDEFNKTLDVQKINEAAQALEQLKQATNYDESVKQIQKLKEEITRLEKKLSESYDIKSRSMYELTIDQKKREVAELEEKIKSVTEAEKQYNEAQQLARALDYQSVQDSSRKIALKIREIESNKRLFDSYEKVYKKLSEGKSLTEDEIELNNKLINDYPEYTRVLNEKTGALGVNIETLKSNLEAQEALAIIELNSLKETAKAEKLKTQGLIEETDKRIRAIDSEIKTLEARNQAYAALINADDPNALRYEKFYLNNYNRIKEAGKLLAESKKQLETLRTTVNAWDTLENLSIDDLRKGVTSTSGFFTEDKDKDKSKSTEIYEAKINQFQQLEDALAKVNDEIERNQALTDIAEEKDKINLLSKRIDLYKEEQKILHQLAEARRSVIQQNVGKLQGLGFDTFYDRNANELVIRNMEHLNQLKGKDAEATNKLRKETEELINTTLSLNDANRQAGTQYIQLNKEIKSIEEEQKKYAEDLIESYQEYLLYTIDKQIEEYEELKKSAQERARREIDDLNTEIEKLERKNEELKEQEEREKRLSELAKQRELVENIQKERNVRILQDGKWVYVADPKKLKEATDKLKEMEEDYSRWEAENSRENRIQRLKDQIKEIEDELAKDEERYDKKIKKLQDFTKAHQEEIDKQKFQVTSYSELVQSLAGIEEKSYKQRLDLLDEFVKAYTELMSSIKTEVSTGNVYSSDEINKSSDSSGGGSSSSSSKGATGYNSTDSNTGKRDVLKYDTGGVNDYTGLAILHGKPNAVETVFNAEQGKKLYDFVKNLPYSVIDTIMPKINIPTLNGIGNKTSNVYYNVHIDKVETKDADSFVKLLPTLVHQYK